MPSMLRIFAEIVVVTKVSVEKNFPCVSINVTEDKGWGNVREHCPSPVFPLPHLGLLVSLRETGKVRQNIHYSNQAAFLLNSLNNCSKVLCPLLLSLEESSHVSCGCKRKGPLQDIK